MIPPYKDSCGACTADPEMSLTHNAPALISDWSANASPDRAARALGQMANDAEWLANAAAYSGCSFCATHERAAAIRAALMFRGAAVALSAV